MSYHKTPTPTPNKIISARDITLNGKDEDIVRAFREKGLKDTCPYVVIHIEDMVLTRVGVYHV